MAWDVTVNIEDRPGTLAHLAGTAAEAGINLGAVSAAGTEVHLLVEDGPHLAQILEVAGFRVTSTNEVLLVHIEDRPGALAEVCHRIANEGVNLDTVYTARSDLLAVVVDKPEKVPEDVAQ